MKQTLTINGEDDAFLDGDAPYAIDISTLYTADPDYAAAQLGATVVFVNYDDPTDRKADECEMGLYGWVDVDNGVYNCRKCPIGTYSDTTTNVREVWDCQKCPIGTFGAERGATSIFGDGTTPACQPCPEGFFGDVPGQAICSPCPTYVTTNDEQTGVTTQRMVCGMGSVKPIWKNYSKMSDGYVRVGS
jgi:hypothetical protein